MLANLKKALVLFLIGAVSGLSIWAVNLVTEDRIDNNVRGREEGFYKEILGIDLDTEIAYVTEELDNGLIEIIVFDDVNEDGLFNEPEVAYGIVYKGEDSNNYGDISVLVGIKDDQVMKVVISESTNTPNFVKRVEKNYLENFEEVAVDSVTYDEKTGASYTYGSVQKIVDLSIDSYQERGDE